MLGLKSRILSASCARSSSTSAIALILDFKNGIYQQQRARTNLLLSSFPVFGTGWTSPTCGETLSALAVSAPYAAMATKLYEADTALTYHWVGQSVTLPAGTYTASCYAKAAERRYVWIEANGLNINATFDLQTGTVVATTGTVTPIITGGANGEYRCAITFSTSGATLAARIGLSNVASVSAYSGTANSGAYVWGAQLEAAPAASAYIPTTSAPVSVIENVTDRTPLRTNFSANSVNPAYTTGPVSGATVTANYGVAPDGTQTAVRVQLAAGNSYFSWGTAGAAYSPKMTGSFYIKAAAPVTVQARIASGNGLGTPFYRSINVTTSWQRVVLNGIVPGDTNFTLSIDNRALAGGDNLAKDVTLWGPQVESGIDATDYIPNPSTTTPATVGGITSLYGYTYSRSGAKAEVRVNPFAYGPELVTNGGFDTAAGWTAGGGWSIGSGVASASASGSLLQAFTPTPGKTYEISWDITANTAGTVTPNFSGGTTVNGIGVGGVGRKTQYLTAVTGNANLGFTASGSPVLSIDNVSVREVQQYSLGAELSPGVVTTTGWTLGSATSFASNGATLTFVSSTGGNSFSLLGLVVGKTYQLVSAGDNSANVVWQDGAGGVYLNGHGSASFTASRGELKMRAQGAGTVNFTNISVKEVIPQAIVQAPANVPDIVSGDGYWSRPAFTNTVLYSQDFTNAAWAKFSETPASGAIIAPDGSLTGSSLVRASTAANAYTATTVSGAIGSTVTASVFVKAKSAGNRFGFRVQGSYPDRADAVFDLNAGTVVGTAATSFTGTIATITPVGNGWYRCTVTTTVGGTVLNQIVMGPTDSSLSIAGWEAASTVLSDCYLWQAQLVQGAVPGPVIVTTNAAATVGGDAMSLAVNSFDTSNSDFMILATVNFTDASGLDERPLILTDGTQNNRIAVLRNPNGSLASFMTTNGVSQGLNAPAASQLTPGRVAYAMRVKAGKVTVGVKTPNGVVTLSSETTGLTIPSVNIARIGSDASFGYVSNPVEFVGIRKGTFSDTDLTAMLGAL